MKEQQLPKIENQIQPEMMRDGEIVDIVIEQNNPELASYIKDISNRYPRIRERFKSVFLDKTSDNYGLFTGGPGQPYEIALDPVLLKSGFHKEAKYTMAHEWGHAIFQHIQDVVGFFRYYKLKMPDSLEKMEKFIELIQIKGNKKTFTEKRREITEKFADLFMKSENSGKNNKMIDFKNIFNEDTLGEQWIDDVYDEELKIKWNKLFIN